jgi:hypothetical protein
MLEARHGGLPEAAVVVVVPVAVVVAVADVVGLVALATLVALVALVAVVAVLAVVVDAGPPAVAVAEVVDELPALPHPASSIVAAMTMARRLRSFPFTPEPGVVRVSRADYGP